LNGNKSPFYLEGEVVDEKEGKHSVSSEFLESCSDFMGLFEKRAFLKKH
jgi:hypothetical protein